MSGQLPEGCLHSHSQGEGKQLAPKTSPNSSCCHIQPAIHLPPWPSQVHSSYHAAEPEDSGTILWIFSSLGFCCYLNHSVILALPTMWKSGTPTVSIPWRNIPGWDGKTFGFSEIYDIGLELITASTSQRIICHSCCVLSGKELFDGLITRRQNSY